MKRDGVRALAFIDDGELRLASRTGRDITVAYPELSALGPAAGRQLLLDGEVVAFDDGRPSFAQLQQRMHVTSAAQAARLSGQIPACYLIFDVLHADGHPLLHLPYAQRRPLLESLDLDAGSWQVPPSFTGYAAADVLAASRDHGLEGIVAKRLDSPYQPGRRSPDWRKVKNFRRQEVVVGGWKPGEGNRAGQIGSLLVGVYGPRGLGYAGHVGTGFTQQALRLKADHDRRLAALDDFLAAYEAEYGVITKQEMHDAARRARAGAVVVRGRPAGSKAGASGGRGAA